MTVTDHPSARSLAGRREKCRLEEANERPTGTRVPTQPLSLTTTLKCEVPITANVEPKGLEKVVLFVGAP